MSLDYPILPICQTAESFRNILSAMGPYRDSISLKKSPLLGLYTGSEAQLDLATVRYHALGAYAKSAYLVIFGIVQSSDSIRIYLVEVIPVGKGETLDRNWGKILRFGRNCQRCRIIREALYILKLFDGENEV